MSRTVKVIIALAVIALLWKTFSGDSSEVEVEYEPATVE